jgi:hypothetical protein
MVIVIAAMFSIAMWDNTSVLSIITFVALLAASFITVPALTIVEPNVLRVNTPHETRKRLGSTEG